MMNILPPSLKLRRTSKKQTLFTFVLCFTFFCPQNIYAMRCNIKSLIVAHKAPHSILTSFPNGDPNSPLKKLQQIYDSLESIEPTCFATVEKTNACKYQESCCLLAKNSAKLAKKGKAVRLKKTFSDNDIACIYILKETVKRLSTLQQKNMEARNILLESQNKDTITPFYKELCELTKNISECLVYSANIYGTTFYECSGRYYKKNPRGLFDSTQHMTPQEHEREDLQDECNKIYKVIAKSNGHPLNRNILLGWGEHTMDSSCHGAWLDAIEKAMKAHDEYKKNGGGVY